METVFKAKYEEHNSKLTSEFKKWYQNRTFIDVTVHAGGQSIEAHKLVLAANSPFFNGIFQDTKRENSHCFFTDVPYQSMKSLIEYMYSGELVVEREFLPACLQLADSLKVRGISGLNYDEIITEPVPVSAKMQNLITRLMLQMPPEVERKKMTKKKYNFKRKITKSAGNPGEITNRNVNVSRLIFKKNKRSGGYKIKKVHRTGKKAFQASTTERVKTSCLEISSLILAQRSDNPDKTQITDGTKAENESKTILNNADNTDPFFIIENISNLKLQLKRKNKKRKEGGDFMNQLNKLKKFKANKLEQKNANSIVVQNEEPPHTSRYKEKTNDLNDQENITTYEEAPRSESPFREQIPNLDTENILPLFTPCVQCPLQFEGHQTIPTNIMCSKSCWESDYKNSEFGVTPPKNFAPEQSQEQLFNKDKFVIKKDKPIGHKKSNSVHKNYIRRHENYKKPPVHHKIPVRNQSLQFEELFCESNSPRYDYDYIFNNSSSEGFQQFSIEDYEKLSPQKESNVHVPIIKMGFPQCDSEMEEKINAGLIQANDKKQGGGDITSKGNESKQKRMTICPIPENYWKDDRLYFRCTLCKRAYTHKSNYRRHYMVFHKRCEEAVFKCPLCDKKFTRSDNRTHHIRRIHKINNTASIFTEKKNSYICPLCKKSFTRNYNRTLHIKVVHGITDTASVLCDVL